LALLSEGTSLAIVGNRGIGKTSLARQIVSIASGNYDLLEKLNLKFDKSHKLDFMTTYFACGNTIETLTDLLNALITSKNVLGDWIYEIPKAKQIIESYNPGFSIPGIAKFDGQKSTTSSSERAVTTHRIEIVATNVFKELAAQKLGKNGILVVVDEFDQIRDPSGFASFLKSLSTNVPEVRFCIVGVAEDIRQLMKEHESTDRLFSGSILSLLPMSEPELVEIIDIAESHVKNSIVFDPNARKTLVKLAQGHPYMVHLVGKFAFRQAFDSASEVVKDADIQTALRGIAERGTDPVLEGRYKKAVASSAHREIVLKAMAEAHSDDGEIFTTNAYQTALNKGVDNASQYVGHLTSDQYGSELVKVRERYYRFRDSLFRTYVGLRPAIFQGPLED
jgi:Cdc6-like AAA superfamily ATPase